MRFDDSLKTVLSADMATGFGAQSAWRQLVDLMGRARIIVDEPAIARLRMLRQAVPTSVRAASGRALAFAQPPAALVGFFAEDELAIAAPVLRTATLSADEWCSLLPGLTPAGRSVLRHRRDLDGEVIRALAVFGAIDFVLPYDALPAAADTIVVPDTVARPEMPQPLADTPRSESPFVALGDIARGLPVVAEAMRHSDASATDPSPALQPQSEPSGFVISDLVARIDAFNRRRAAPAFATQTESVEAGTFRYETDAAGAIRWVDGVARAALIGVSFAHAAQQGMVQIDGVATGALRRRSAFSDARLQIDGASDAAGSWRVSGVPVFDHDTGRFTGFRGAARRPRVDETTEPKRPARSAVSDSLRQLVHELRTPTNAIAGFAELIETELLGPIPEIYRGRAATIRSQAAELLAAIDDLDMAARIEGNALDLRATTVAVTPLIARVIEDLAPLARLRGCAVRLDPASVPRDVAGDDRAIERLFGRLLAALTSAGGQGEGISIVVSGQPADIVAVTFDRPRALGVEAGDTLLSLDSERETEGEGAPLLGTGFALRLAQNLAVELGGALTIDADRLTLRLPAAVDRSVGQALNN